MKDLSDITSVTLINISIPNALNNIHFITIIESPTCFGTGTPSSGSHKTKEHKPVTLVCPY